MDENQSEPLPPAPSDVLAALRAAEESDDLEIIRDNLQLLRAALEAQDADAASAAVIVAPRRAAMETFAPHTLTVGHPIRLTASGTLRTGGSAAIDAETVDRELVDAVGMTDSVEVELRRAPLPSEVRSWVDRIRDSWPTLKWVIGLVVPLVSRFVLDEDSRGAPP